VSTKTGLVILKAGLTKPVRNSYQDCALIDCERDKFITRQPQKVKMKINHHTSHLMAASNVFFPGSDIIFPGPVSF